MSDTYLTPRALADRWACRPAHVLSLIRSGALRAIDISASAPHSRRPAYRIPADEVAAYEQRRQVCKASPTPARAVRRVTPAKYYP